MSTPITASTYNNLRDRLNLVMGLGSTGYGQVLSSSSVQAGETFTLAMWDNLRTDMLKTRQHQTGVSESSNLSTVTTSTDISTALINQYDAFITLISTNQRVIANNQATVENLVTAVRTLAWNGTITHTVTVTFTDTLRARYFFNAGGQIRFSASRTGTAATSKDTNWTNVLSSMGTLYMNHNSSGFLPGGSGSGSARGFYNLTTTFQTLFIKGSSVYAYQENDYNIAARVDNATTPRIITFRIEFRDDDLGNSPIPPPGPPPYGPKVDEPVTGVLTSTVSSFRPSGSNVSVTGPTATQTSLA